MPINVFDNSNSNDKGSKVDKSLFVQKQYFRNNYIESNIDHDINLKKQYRIKNFPLPVNDQDGVSKIYIEKKIVEFIKRNIQNDD